ncbi:hypothetical protein PENTCL1PPCAC_10458, partial [Pristionchus entomophagus]
FYMCSNFFVGGAVNEISVTPATPENVDFNSWLDFIRTFGPKIVNYARMPIDQEIDFILSLAEIVEGLSIEGFDETSGPVLISLVRKILSRKCNYFQI